MKNPGSPSWGSLFSVFFSVVDEFLFLPVFVFFVLVVLFIVFFVIIFIVPVTAARRFSGKMAVLRRKVLECDVSILEFYRQRAFGFDDRGHRLGGIALAFECYDYALARSYVVEIFKTGDAATVSLMLTWSTVLKPRSMRA